MILFTWIVDKILQALDFRTKVKVLVHEAFFIGDQNKEPHYFVKVANCSPETTFTITHIWVKDSSKEIDIINQERPLPHKLEKSDIWETWFRKDIIEDQESVFNNVRVVLSNGKLYKSKRNKKVRPAGFIAK